MIGEIEEIYRESREEYVAKADNEFEVGELLSCREKLVLSRAGNKPVIDYDTDVYRQGVLSKHVHNSIESVLVGKGWEREKKFVKRIEKYILHCRVEGVISSLIIPGGAVIPKKILEIKCPMKLQRRVPDYYLDQVGMYLNITGASECILIIMTKDGFPEYTITEKMPDEDILWLIENGRTPWFKKECEACWYRSYCDKV